MAQPADDVAMIAILIAFIVVVGPLAVLFGADSRLDEPRR
jgi:hypothetical protein